MIYKYLLSELKILGSVYELFLYGEKACLIYPRGYTQGQTLLNREYTSLTHTVVLMYYMHEGRVVYSARHFPFVNESNPPQLQTKPIPLATPNLCYSGWCITL